TNEVPHNIGLGQIEHIRCNDECCFLFREIELGDSSIATETLFHNHSVPRARVDGCTETSRTGSGPSISSRPSPGVKRPASKKLSRTSQNARTTRVSIRHLAPASKSEAYYRDELAQSPSLPSR